MKTKPQGPRVLFVDIETAPMLGYVWSLWENNVALNQLHSDWYVLSWAARWRGDPPGKMLYQDQRKAKVMEDDKEILKGIWKLLDEADVVVGQNGKAFDVKKLNARFILQGLKPPSSYKIIDTMLLAKKHFGFTSNKLEYMADKLCVKYKKLTQRVFAGFDLWKGCLARNKAAWTEMEKYNKHDVLALEEVFNKLITWDSSVNFDMYTDDEVATCKCGSTEFQRYGYAYTGAGKYQRYQCKSCGTETRDKVNLFSKTKKASLRVNVPRS